MLHHEMTTLPRSNKRRRLLQDQLKMWETFTPTDVLGHGFTLTKENKNHRVAAFERLAIYLMGKLAGKDVVTHWNRDGDTITFHAVEIPRDNTVWCKADTSWYMPQRHPMWS